MSPTGWCGVGVACCAAAHVDEGQKGRRRSSCCSQPFAARALTLSVLLRVQMGFENNAGKFFYFTFIIYLTLNLMAFYGIMVRAWKPAVRFVKVHVCISMHLTAAEHCCAAVKQGVYVTPSLVVASVLSGFFYGRTPSHLCSWRGRSVSGAFCVYCMPTPVH